MKKALVLTLLLSIAIPQMALAAWWNPLSWKVFSWLSQPKTVYVQSQQTATTTATSTVPTASTTPAISQPDNGAKENINPKPSFSHVQKPKITTATQTPVPETQTITLPNGAIVEIDVNGNILKYIKESPQIQTQPTPINTSTTFCNGKYYNGCPTGSDLVCPSSGTAAYCQPQQYITPSVVTPPTLTPSVPTQQPQPTPTQVPPPPIHNPVKTLQIEPIQCGSNPTLGTSCGINVRYLEDGVITNSESVTISSSDGYFTGTPWYQRPACTGGEALDSNGSVRGNPISCATGKPSAGIMGELRANFTYYPTSANLEAKAVSFKDGVPIEYGDFITRTITASANGASASQTFTGNYVLTYLPSNSLLDPIITKGTKLLDEGRGIGSFKLSMADEPIKLTGIEYETDIKDKNFQFRLYCGGSSGGVGSGGNESGWSSLTLDIACPNSKYMEYWMTITNAAEHTGQHTLTITKVKTTGSFSGSTREVQGLPLTFTFKVQ